MVNLFLKTPHLFHQLVEIVGLIGIPHQDRDFVKPVDFGLDRRNRLHQVFANRGVEVQFRFLRHIADTHSLDHRHFAVVIGIEPRHDL